MSALLTTSNGNPVEDNQHSLTAGPKGPVLLQDFALIDKLAHFDSERIPERVVHAKGAGAHGFFECTAANLAQYTKARFLQKQGQRTPVFVRFSTVGGEKGSGDTERDPRGFAIKFYTDEGNWDLVGNNTPVFFIRDPIKFPDFIHTQKRNPQSNLKDPDMFWDFLSLVPESIHQGYRYMNGHSSHTLKLINKNGQEFFTKWHIKTDQGIKNLTRERATELVGAEPDYATHDLFNAIKKQQFPSWTVSLQVFLVIIQLKVMTPQQANLYRWNILDVTKVWPHKDFPLIQIGRLTLNRNPDNYFQDTEQVAFSPSHLVPGIEPSFDKMLQGRLFSYPDTHRHRLGLNYQQIPVNRPMCCPVLNQQRDGFMCVNGNQGSAPNYEPNSTSTSKIHKKVATSGQGISLPASECKHHIVPLTQDDFVQAGNLYRLQSPEAKARLISNVVNHLGNAKPYIRQRQISHFSTADRQLGSAIEKVTFNPLISIGNIGQSRKQDITG